MLLKSLECTNYNKQIFRVSGSYNFMKSAKVDKN